MREVPFRRYRHFVHEESRDLGLSSGGTRFAENSQTGRCPLCSVALVMTQRGWRCGCG